MNKNKKNDKNDFTGLNLFNLAKTDFLEKLGEGILYYFDFIGAFGKVRLARIYKDMNELSTDDDSDENKAGAGSNNSSPEVPRRVQKVEASLVAVKILSKGALIKAKQVDHVYNEISLQLQLKHPFIVSYSSNYKLTPGRHGECLARQQVALHNDGIH